MPYDTSQPTDSEPSKAPSTDPSSEIGGDLGQQTVPKPPSRPWWKQAISIVVTLTVLIVVFGFVLPQLADYDAVREYISDIDFTEWIVLGLFSIWFLVAYPIVLMQVMRTLRFNEGFVNHMTGTAITNSVPSGGALALPLNYGIYMSWGFTPGVVSAGLLGAGVWDWLARLSLPVLAVIGIAIIGDAVGWMWVVSLVGITVVAVMVVTLVKVLSSEVGAASMARFADSWGSKVLGLAKRDNPGIRAMVLQFREDLKGIIDHRMLRLSLATVGNHLAMATLFTASVYSVGVSSDQIAIPWVVLAFTLGRFLVMIPVSPGGLGLVDLGWIGLLTLGWEATSGTPADADLIAAGVLLFRALSFLPPIPVGMASWLCWRANKSWQKPWQTVRRGADSTVPTETATEH